jgi:CheY-like chemotaxis protein
METIKKNDRIINVLFVDNDSSLVEDLGDYIKKSEIERQYGLSFTFVRDAKSAMRKLTEININLIVLEIVLPLVSGYHLINAIREIDKSIPIIIYTRIKNPQDLAKMASSKVNNIFLKELMKKEDLIEIIRKKETVGNIDATVMELNSQIKALHEGERQMELKLTQCPNCHMILAPEAHFCNNCGQKIFRKSKKLLAKTENDKKTTNPEEGSNNENKKKQ